MKSVGAFAAKTHLSHLLDEVKQGHVVTINKRGKAIAKLVPIDTASDEKLNIKELLADFRAIRQRAGSKTKVKQWIEEGRKR